MNEWMNENLNDEIVLEILNWFPRPSFNKACWLCGGIKQNFWNRHDLFGISHEGKNHVFYLVNQKV